jgi:hypothetical protein
LWSDGDRSDAIYADASPAQVVLNRLTADGGRNDAPGRTFQRHMRNSRTVVLLMLLAAGLRQRNVPIARRAVCGGAVPGLIAAFLLAACSNDANSSGRFGGESATTSAAVVAARQPTSFRFVKAPVVAYYAEAGSSGQWAIVVRLNKALPIRSDRRPRADLRIDRNPSEAGPSRVGSRKGRACYVASYSSENDVENSPQLVKPRNGQRVTVTLYFNKRKSVDVRTSARRAGSLAGVNTHEGIQPFLAQLGCV